MILNKVTIKNFRQYRDVEINFAKDSDKNFTIIQDNNGTGKTTLLNALSWCLYESEIHKIDNSKETKGLDICNNKTFYLADNQETIEIKVIIEFLDDGKILSFNRCNYYRKSNNKLLSLHKRNKFYVVKQEGTNDLIEDDPHYILERKIPKDIEDYFFFDGARLSEYFQKTKNSKIKDAVFNVSQLTLFEKVSSNLNKVKQNYISKQKTIKPKLGKSEEKVLEIENLIQTSENEIITAQNNIKKFKIEIDNVEKELSSKGEGSVQKDVFRNKELEKN